MKIYFKKVWSLYWRVSTIHLSVILFALAMSYFVSPLIPGEEQPEAYGLFLVFFFFSIIFIPANILWSFIVGAFHRRFYMTAGIVLSVLFQGLLFAGIALPFGPGNWERANLLNPFAVILLSYGLVLILSLYSSRKSIVPFIDRLTEKDGHTLYSAVDWNSKDN